MRDFTAFRENSLDAFLGFGFLSEHIFAPTSCFPWPKRTTKVRCHKPRNRNLFLQCHLKSTALHGAHSCNTSFSPMRGKVLWQRSIQHHPLFCASHTFRRNNLAGVPGYTCLLSGNTLVALFLKNTAHDFGWAPLC